jgi:hypothetical protein
MWQLLKLFKLDKMVTCATTIGRSIIEVYVCSRELANFSRIAEQEQLNILEDFDPSDFSYIADDDARTKARDSAATRMGYLLSRHKFINLRKAILEGFDQTMREKAYLCMEEANDKRLFNWHARHDPRSFSRRDGDSDETMGDASSAPEPRQPLFNRILQRDTLAAQRALNGTISSQAGQEPAVHGRPGSNDL